MVSLTFGFSFCEFGFWDVLGCLDVVELVRFGISWGLCCCGGLVCLIAYFGGCLGGFGFWDVFGRWFWLATSCLVLLSLGFPFAFSWWFGFGVGFVCDWACGFDGLGFGGCCEVGGLGWLCSFGLVYLGFGFSGIVCFVCGCGWALGIRVAFVLV